MSQVGPGASNCSVLLSQQSLDFICEMNDPLLGDQSDRSKAKVKVKSLSHVRLFATPWTVAYQDLPSMGFSRQVYWSGLPFPSPGALPDPGIDPGSSAFQADALTKEIYFLLILSGHENQL